MGDDGDVLRFRSREGLDPPDEYDREPVPRDESYDGYESYDRFEMSDRFATCDRSERHREHGHTGLGDLTQVILVGDQVLDVVPCARRPVAGSGYECATLELRDRGLLRPQPPAPPPVPPGYEQQLAWLARIVGGEEALGALGVEPLEPEELCLDDVRPSLRDRVRGIDVRLEQWAPVLLGDEGQPAARRLLTRAVAAEPALLRSDRDDVATGAVLWAVAKGNDLVGTNRPVRASVIQEVCGLVSDAVVTWQRLRPCRVGRGRDAVRPAGLDVRHPAERDPARQSRPPARAVPPHARRPARHLAGAEGGNPGVTVTRRPGARDPPGELEQGHTVAACRCPPSVTCSLPSTWSPSRCGCRSVG